MVTCMQIVTPNAAHWGAFDAVVEDGRLVEARPAASDAHPGGLFASMPDVVHHKTRIDRPYARAGWLRGERRGAQRGGDAWVPLEWDQAIRLVAEDTAHIREAHGHDAILGGSYGWSSAGRFHHARSQLHRYLGMGGGFVAQVTNYSYGAGMTLMPHVLGTNEVVQGPVTDWTSLIAHTRLMLCLGGLPLKNGLVTAGGAGSHEYVPLMRRAAAAGVRFVNVSPFRGDAPDFLQAEWVAIRPGSDAAFLLAMAQTIVAAGLEDRGFLATHAVGWPQLRAYITGEADGQPKTPEWAEALTDVPAATIRRLALEAAAAPTMLTATWSIQRSEHGEQPWWMLVALAAILGGIGKPGQGVGFGYGSINGMGTPRHDLPSVSLPPTRNPVATAIPVSRVTDLLERPGEILQYNGRDILLPDIRQIWWAGGNPFHHHQDLGRLSRAFSRADTIIVQEPWWTAVARQADIVLPATTTLERRDIMSSSRDRHLRAMHKAIPAQGQARDDHAILADLADAAGFRDRFTEQRDEDAWLRHLYGRWARGVAQAGLEAPDFDTFWAQGAISFPAPAQPFVSFADFAADPEANPLATPSGKVELYSATIAGFGYAEVPGHPVWMAPAEWLGAAAPDEMHLLSYQPATRLHGQLDPGRVAAADKILGREPILMHPEDAADRGLVAGQVVRVFNARGTVAGGLRLSDGIRRGVVAMATGAWWDPMDAADPSSPCIHGNPNVLTRDIGTSRLGQGCAAQSCLVRVAPWDGALPPVAVHTPPV